jgi:hypothetical protein
MIMATNKSCIRILFLAALPLDMPPLRLAEECRAIDQALQRTKFRNHFEMQDHWAVQVDDLQELLLRHKPHIVHFSGHGSPSNEIIFQDGHGKPQPLSPEVLGRLFCLLRDNIKCVVLNACYTERQAQEIAKHISCVIGISDAIRDDAAIQFSIAFYRALGFGRDMQTAFELGRLEIESGLSGLTEHLKPQLLSPTCDPSNIFVLQTQDPPSPKRSVEQCVASSNHPLSKAVPVHPVKSLRQDGEEEYWIPASTIPRTRYEVVTTNELETCILCDIS